jgi:type I restriction enzyme, R subunit
MPSDVVYQVVPDPRPSVVREDGIEDGFIGKLRSLKYEYRLDIHNRAALEANFRENFEALNRLKMTEGEFALGMRRKNRSDCLKHTFSRRANVPTN